MVKLMRLLMLSGLSLRVSTIGDTDIASLHSAEVWAIHPERSSVENQGIDYTQRVTKFPSPNTVPWL